MIAVDTILPFILYLSFIKLASGQFGCGQPTPPPFQFPPLFTLPPPCTYATTPLPPIIQPAPPSPNCRGCPVYQQLPPLLPVPRVYPEIPPGEYLNRPTNPIYVKDTKIIRHELEDDNNSSKPELFDDPERDRNTTFFASPIVPEVASYKHPNYYYSYNNNPYSQQPQPQNNYGYGCGFQPLPTPQPFVFPTPAPLPQPTIPPLNNCCGRCQCPIPNPYYGPKMRGSRLLRHDRIASRCTNRRLEFIMEEHRNLTVNEAKIAIQRSAELKLRDGYYHVFCSNQNLEYVTRTESYCTYEMLDGICYSFRTQF